MFGGIPKYEIDKLHEYWEAFPTLKTALFDDISSEYTDIKCENIKQTITEHNDVKSFIEKFDTSFGNFNDFLKSELLQGCETLKIQKEEALLSSDIFKRLENIPLIDKYEAYQLLSDKWLNIAVDLEIIQTEGFNATKQVDANMVLKKKAGKEQEVQDGWIGHIMPFALVQATYLKDELEALEIKEQKVAEITAKYEEILESFSEEEKESDTIKESKDAFINAVVVKEAKLLRAGIKKGNSVSEDSYETKILEVDALISEEKKLKKAINDEKIKLHLLTKETIENLSDAQVYELLELKWITPLTSAIEQLPKGIIENLTNALDSLAQKYETTLKNIDDEIKQTQQELSVMIDELDGSAFDMQGLQAFQELLEVRNEC